MKMFMPNLDMALYSAVIKFLSSCYIKVITHSSDVTPTDIFTRNSKVNSAVAGVTDSP